MDNRKGMSGQYTAYGSKDIIRSNIAMLDVQVGNLSSRVKQLFKRKQSYADQYWVFYEFFNNLFYSSVIYVQKPPKRIEELREYFDNPNEHDPLALIKFYEEYKIVLKKSGISEIGYYETGMSEGLMNRT